MCFFVGVWCWLVVVRLVSGLDDVVGGVGGDRGGAVFVLIGVGGGLSRCW